MPPAGGAPRKPRVVAKKPTPVGPSFADKVLQKPASKPRVKAKPIGGRAIHDVVAASQAVSRGKPPPKPTVRRKPTLKDLKGFHGTGTVKTESGAGKLANITAPASVALPILAAVDAATGAKGPKTALKILKNAPVDAADLAVGTPAALYHLGDTAIHHPGKLPGMFAQPYKDFAKDPGKFVIDKPVTSLMMAEPLRLPGRAVGAALRKAGKQTLERAPATLPATAVKANRTKSRAVVRNAIQTRKDRGKPAPTLTDKPGIHVAHKGIKATELERQVDEFYGAAQKHKIRVRNAATKSAETRGYTGARAAEHISGAAGGAGRVIDRRLAQTFGSTWSIDPKTKAILKNPTADKGALHPTKEAAQRVADAINNRGLFDAVVRDAGKSSFGVVPKTVAKRIEHHVKVGRSPAVGSVVMRESRRAFGRAVLPFSKNFLLGQAGEAAYRSAATGAGPTSWVRGRAILKHQAELNPQAAKAFRDRSVGDKHTQTGHAGHAAEYMGGPKTLADAFNIEGMPPSLVKVTRGVTKAAAAPGIKQARGAFHGWSHVVFNKVNATIERNAQTAMLGKAIKQSPLGERHVIGLTSKAIDEYARGLMHTPTQVAAVRELHRMYGKYNDFSPAMREALMHTTPFLPWYINTARFVLRLPVDHPLHAALVADIDQASQEWRKAHGYSLHGGVKIPDFLTGGPLGRWLPFPQKDVSGAVGGLFLPQFEATAAALVQGVDWKGKQIKGSKALNAALGQVESLVPGVSQVDRATGVGDAHVRHKTGAKSVFNGKTLDEVKRDLVKQVDVTSSFKTKTTTQPAAPSSGRPVLKGPKVRLKSKPVLKSTRAVLK